MNYLFDFFFAGFSVFRITSMKGKLTILRALFLAITAGVIFLYPGIRRSNSLTIIFISSCCEVRRCSIWSIHRVIYLTLIGE